uniref:WGS project CBMI000000000 data, contig CS3069_c001616 n=1 Tax=Fusarium clavum TaxID=2594811 RepID=A0A090MBT1_9HYPO|nr:unnamed protein product [Fusarium clavum]
MRLPVNPEKSLNLRWYYEIFHCSDNCASICVTFTYSSSLLHELVLEILKSTLSYPIELHG